MNMTTRAELLAAATVADPRWASVATRDPKADESFVYSVRTTGVYCRPSCGARTPRPGNVAFHATPADAERAGFRPCKRCKPDQAPLAARQCREGGGAVQAHRKRRARTEPRRAREARRIERRTTCIGCSRRSPG